MDFLYFLTQVEKTQSWNVILGKPKDIMDTAGHEYQHFYIIST